MAAGTLLSTTRWHHWFVRGWDFPRLQIALLAALAGALYLPFWQGGLLDGLFLAMELPTVVVGDFNDVAWSRTTELFREISGLLDPRRGRGLYNTFHARRWYFRFPLDHVFHSKDFRLIRLERLDSVGSDHFPIRAALAAEPLAPVEQEEPEADGDAQEEADQMVEVAAEQEETDVDPGDAKDPDIGKAPGRQADPTS